MKISARNQLKGKVTEVKPGATTSHVGIDIGGGNVVMASITNEAVADLGIKVGDARKYYDLDVGYRDEPVNCVMRIQTHVIALGGMPDATDPWGIQGFGNSSGPAFSF